jgi:sec-independent protein translocase protein TatA
MLARSRVRRGRVAEGTANRASTIAPMPNIGPLELAIVLIIALVIFGPKRLPELGRSMGRGLREFKSSVTGEKDKDEDRTPAELEEPSKAEEPVEGEVVADRRS